MREYQSFLISSRASSPWHLAEEYGRCQNHTMPMRYIPSYPTPAYFEVNISTLLRQV